MAQRKEAKPVYEVMRNSLMFRGQQSSSTGGARLSSWTSGAPKQRAAPVSRTPWRVPRCSTSSMDPHLQGRLRAGMRPSEYGQRKRWGFGNSQGLIQDHSIRGCKHHSCWSPNVTTGINLHPSFRRQFNMGAILQRGEQASSKSADQCTLKGD